jgi:hypothetical protein
MAVAVVAEVEVVVVMEDLILPEEAEEQGEEGLLQLLLQ